MQAQVNFKKQVQEWKNVLIRGGDPALREKYFGQFEDREADLAAHLMRLLNFAILGDEPVGEIEQLIADLKQSGLAFREAL